MVAAAAAAHSVLVATLCHRCFAATVLLVPSTAGVGGWQSLPGHLVLHRARQLADCTQGHKGNGERAAVPVLPPGLLSLPTPPLQGDGGGPIHVLCTVYRHFQFQPCAPPVLVLASPCAGGSGCTARCGTVCSVLFLFMLRLPSCVWGMGLLMPFQFKTHDAAFCCSSALFPPAACTLCRAVSHIILGYRDGVRDPACTLLLKRGPCSPQSSVVVASVLECPFNSPLVL